MPCVRAPIALALPKPTLLSLSLFALLVVWADSWLPCLQHLGGRRKVGIRKREKRRAGQGRADRAVDATPPRRSRIFYCLLPGQGPSFLQRAPRLAPLAGQETISDAGSEKRTRRGRRRVGDYEYDDAKAQEKVVKQVGSYDGKKKVIGEKTLSSNENTLFVD